jgi:hypothetical protein
MMKLLRLLLCCLFFACMPIIQGCVQMPTERHGIVDIRPHISFRIADAALGASRVYVDGLDMGPASAFIDGVAGLRVLPGSHLLQVRLQGMTLIDEKFYVADGVSRTFVLAGGNR